MAAHADDLVAVLDFLGVDQTTLIGHAMGAFASIVCADYYPDRVQNLVLIDGGIPLELGPIARLPTDQLLAILIGPALDRLHRTFESVATYLDYWRRRLALVDAWNSHKGEAIVYDLGGQPPTVREDAVIADAESELSRDDFDRVLARLAMPAVLFHAERGILNQTPPLYPAYAVAAWLDAAPALRSVNIPNVNHYTILLTEHGAKTVSDAFEQLLR
ncbi:MAG: alpha/beta hydrolase [Mycobacterium nebraskense]|nr:alpha/beta hydrolase [Mycobacterium nebraskense]